MAYDDCDEDPLKRVAGCEQCVPGDGPQLWTGTAADGAWADRPDTATVSFFGADISAVAFASTCISISVVTQVAVFVTVGPMADYGAWRMRLL